MISDWLNVCAEKASNSSMATSRLIIGDTKVFNGTVLQLICIILFYDFIHTCVYTSSLQPKEQLLSIIVFVRGLYGVTIGFVWSLNGFITAL
ncbi:MAG: hypothetical protein ACM3VS_19150 [Candidatus Dadabacteria bacterium]